MILEYEEVIWISSKINLLKDQEVQLSTMHLPDQQDCHTGTIIKVPYVDIQIGNFSIDQLY